MEISFEYYDNFYRPFLRKKSVMYQRDVINKKNKIIRSKIFLKIRKQWLEFSAEWSLRYQKCYESIRDLINLKMKAELSFETPGSNYPTQECLLPRCENRFATNITFQRCVISRRECEMISALSSFQVFFLSLSLVTEATKCLAVLRVEWIVWERGVV